jgi:hypothetical protein
MFIVKNNECLRDTLHLVKKKNNDPHIGLAKEDWTEHLRSLVSRGEWVSVDFWNTLVIETQSREFVRKIVSSKLVAEFELKLSNEDLYENFCRVSNGLTSISKDFGLDGEYKLSSAWFYSAVNFFTDAFTARNFANRAIEIEIEISFLYSFVHEDTRILFNSLSDSKLLLIASDFEGDSSFLRKVARLHGLLLPEIVLVSSEHFLNKRSSRLFKVHPNLGKGSFHFGDNPEADIIGAQLAGITAIQVEHLSLEIPKKGRKPVFPRPLPSFQNDKKACVKMLSHFKNEFDVFVNTGDVVIFLGSEGAFLSSVVTNCENGLTFSCFNGGRRMVMLACLETHTSWMISRYLQENVCLSVIFEILGIEIADHEARKQAFYSVASAHNEIRELLSVDQIIESRAAKSQISRDFAISTSRQRIVLVDIGYRGTFAQGIARLFNCELAVLQVFGSECELNQVGVAVSTMFNEADGFEFRRSIPMIELLFGAGPRASISNESLSSFQRDLWKPPRKLQYANVSDEILRMLHWPSRKLLKLIYTAVANDDFSNQVTPFLSKKLTLKQKITSSQLAHYYFGKTWVVGLFFIKMIRYRQNLRRVKSSPYSGVRSPKP